MRYLFGFLLIGLSSIFLFLGIVAPPNIMDYARTHRKSDIPFKLFGYKGARVFYIILGLGLVIAGILIAAGVVKES